MTIDAVLRRVAWIDFLFGLMGTPQAAVFDEAWGYRKVSNSAEPLKDLPYFCLCSAGPTRAQSGFTTEYSTFTGTSSTFTSTSSTFTTTGYSTMITVPPRQHAELL